MVQSHSKYLVRTYVPVFYTVLAIVEQITCRSDELLLEGLLGKLGTLFEVVGILLVLELK